MNNTLKIICLLMSSACIGVISFSKYPLVIIMCLISAIALAANALILG